MKYAKDFRAAARDALRGKWLPAVLVAFVAGLLGVSSGIISHGGSVDINSSSSVQLSETQLTDFWLQYRFVLIAAIVLLVIWTIVIVVISGAVRLGYCGYFLKLADGEDVSFRELFSQFHRLGAGFCMNFLVSLFIGLWSMLFVIPGIVKSYSYAMTPYIMLEHPELGACEAITKSRRIMDGNKGRLFCLGLSFIGWGILCAVPAGIGSIIAVTVYELSGSMGALLWMLPFGVITIVGSLFLCVYQEAAFADFYRSISGTANKEPEYLPE